MATLKDVARHSGVSVSTVSRVLNNFSRVDPKTREKVKNAMKELNYFPDENARRLKSNVSNVLGVVVPDIANPFFAYIVRGIENEASKKGFTVVLCDTSADVHMEKQAVSLLMRQKAAGIISASVATGKAARDIYSIPEMNVVFVDNLPDLKADFSSVTINNYAAAKELAGVLLDKGHREICVIAGPKNESSSLERLEGFLSAASERGITIGDDYIRSGDFCIESGAAIMKSFFEAGISPTAVFAANNFMAYGATHVILSAGLRVPEDIEIATFDVIDYTGLVQNKFISVMQPAFDIGRISAQICIDESDKDTVKNFSRIVMKHKLEL